MRKLSRARERESVRVREHFRATAFSFDRLYDETSPVQRLLRPALQRRQEAAVDAVRELGDPRVLDIGCGSGRVGELVLEAGAGEYVGIDFAEPMLELARERLVRFGERARLVSGDFLEADLGEPFDVLLALGLFDYVPDPKAYARRMARLCAGTLVASFPAWSWVKGPIRKVRYEMVNDCPIFDYTAEGITDLLDSAGFASVAVERVGGSGLIARARR